MQNVIFATSLMFGSQLSVTAPRPHLGFIDGADDRWLYYVVLLVAIVTCTCLIVIARTRLGRTLRALSEAPTVLTTSGLNTNVARLLAFCTSAFFAGIGGALSISQTGAANGVAYGPIQSLLLLAVLAISGTRLLRSAIVAAGLLAVAPSYVTGLDSDRQLLVFGGLAIASALANAHKTSMRAWLSHAAATSDNRRIKRPRRSTHHVLPAGGEQ